VTDIIPFIQSRASTAPVNYYLLSTTDTSIATQRQALHDRILRVDEASFEELALDVFRYQAKHNSVYAAFLTALQVSPKDLVQLTDIPFLPIRFFKEHTLRTADWQPEAIFRSSGTTATTSSVHQVRDLQLYRSVSRRIFQHFYGSIRDLKVLALLPSYLERGDSSLVAMADDFIQLSQQAGSGFFLNDLPALRRELQRSQQTATPTLLLGVSFALWDMAEQYPVNFPELIVMETGGMKGRRPELTRPELYKILQRGFGVSRIHSEYGMTELLSQAYSMGAGRFRTAYTMRVLARDVTDPFTYVKNGRSAALNIIDLANLDSISFLATDDLGRQYEDGTFEILGRLDFSDIRGCNLLVL